MGEYPEAFGADGVDYLVGHHARVDPVLHALFQHGVHHLSHRRLRGGWLGSKTIGPALSVDEVGLHETRAKGAHSHRRPGGLQFEIQPLAQGHHTGLGDVVGRRARHRHETGHRRRVHDVALALVFHDRQERANAVDDAIEVDPDHPFPRAERAAPRVAFAHHPGVVTQHMGSTEASHRGVGEGLHLGLERSVAHHGEYLGAALGQRHFHRPHRHRVDIGEYEFHPLGSEPFSERTADTACSAGDHRNLPAQVVHHSRVHPLAERRRSTVRP